MFGAAENVIGSPPPEINLGKTKTRLYKFYKRLSFKLNSHHSLLLKLLVVLDVSIKASGYFYVVADPIDSYENGIASANSHNIYPNHSRHKRRIEVTSYDRVPPNVEDHQNGDSMNVLLAAVKSKEAGESKTKTKHADNSGVGTQDTKAKKTKAGGASGKKTTDRADHEGEDGDEDDVDDEKPIDQVGEEEDDSNINVEKDYKGPVYEGTKITLEFMHQVIDWYKQNKRLHKKYVLKIVRRVRYYYQRQPTLIDVRIARGFNVTIVGDIHGQLFDLLNIFEFNGYPSKDNRYLFNGDFVDRGRYSLECFVVICGFKLLFPSRVYINRGNHESKMMNHYFGFANEVKFKYSEKMLNVFTDVFNWLPLAHRINSRVLILHGGLFAQDGVTLADIKHIERDCEPKPNTLMFDLLWSDPKDGEGRSPNMMRGAGIEFGADVTRAFCIRNKLDFIIRSHYPAQKGYAVQHNGRMVTVFSAPNYYGGNKGAIIQMGAPDLIPEYITFTQTPEPNWETENLVVGNVPPKK